MAPVYDMGVALAGHLPGWLLMIIFIAAVIAITHAATATLIRPRRTPHNQCPACLRLTGPDHNCTPKEHPRWTT